jgi:hypothetical protein
VGYKKPKVETAGDVFVDHDKPTGLAEGDEIEISPLALSTVEDIAKRINLTG